MPSFMRIPKIKEAEEKKVSERHVSKNLGKYNFNIPDLSEMIYSIFPDAND